MRNDITVPTDKSAADLTNEALSMFFRISATLPSKSITKVLQP